MSSQRLKIDENQSKNDFTRVCTVIHKRHKQEIEALIRARRGVTLKGLIYSAIEDYLHPEAKGDLVEEFRREYGSMRKEIRQLRLNHDILLEVFVVFVKMWMCHTHEVPKEHQGAAWASMERRYAKFKTLVLSELKGDERLIDLLVNELNLELDEKGKEEEVAA